MMSGAPEVIAATMLAAFVVGLAKGGLANAGVIAAPIMSLVRHLSLSMKLQRASHMIWW
jgi:hypothetical protein